MLRVEIVDSVDTAHRDILFQLIGVTEVEYFDSYYFGIHLDEAGEDTALSDFLAKQLDYWVANLRKMKDGDSEYLPINYSDQYVGCIHATRQNGNVILTYGCARNDVPYVGSIGSRQFFLNGYESDSPVIYIPIDDFCNAIRLQADNLRRKNT